MGYTIKFPNVFDIDTEWNYTTLESIFGKKILNIRIYSSGYQEIEFVDDMNPAGKTDIKAKLIAENDFSKKIKEK